MNYTVKYIQDGLEEYTECKTFDALIRYLKFLKGKENIDYSKVIIINNFYGKDN